MFELLAVPGHYMKCSSECLHLIKTPWYQTVLLARQFCDGDLFSVKNSLSLISPNVTNQNRAQTFKSIKETVRVDVFTVSSICYLDYPDVDW